jgi:hypothetical protein
MLKRLAMASLFGLAACGGPSLPAPNSATAAYDPKGAAIEVMVSGVQPATSVTLVGPEGRYPAAGMSLISGPHVLYNPPPSIGIGVGGFGFGGCCSGVGTGVGVGLPVGKPTVAEVSDQYVTAARIAAPADYAARWPLYHVEIETTGQSRILAAPPPTT